MLFFESGVDLSVHISHEVMCSSFRGLDRVSVEMFAKIGFDSGHWGVHLVSPPIVTFQIGQRYDGGTMVIIVACPGGKWALLAYVAALPWVQVQNCVGRTLVGTVAMHVGKESATRSDSGSTSGPVWNDDKKAENMAGKGLSGCR